MLGVTTDNTWNGRTLGIAGNMPFIPEQPRFTDGRVIYGNRIYRKGPEIIPKLQDTFFYVNHSGELYYLDENKAKKVGDGYPRILSNLKYNKGWSNQRGIILSDEYPMCCKYVDGDLYSLCADIEKTMSNRLWNRFELYYVASAGDRDYYYLYLKKNNNIISHITFAFEDLLKPFYDNANAINKPNLDAACNGVNPRAILSTRVWSKRDYKTGYANIYPATPTKNGFTFFIFLQVIMESSYYYYTVHYYDKNVYYDNYYERICETRTVDGTTVKKYPSKTYEETFAEENRGTFIKCRNYDKKTKQYYTIYIDYFDNSEFLSTNDTKQDLILLRTEAAARGWDGHQVVLLPGETEVTQNAYGHNGGTAMVSATSNMWIKVDVDLNGNISAEQTAIYSGTGQSVTTHEDWGFTPIESQININNFDLEYDDFTIQYVNNGRNSSGLERNYDTIINDYQYKHFNILNSYTNNIGLIHVIYNQDVGEFANIYQVVNIKNGNILLKDETPLLYDKLFLSDTSDINLSFPSTYILSTKKIGK